MGGFRILSLELSLLLLLGLWRCAVTADLSPCLSGLDYRCGQCPGRPLFDILVHVWRIIWYFDNAATLTIHFPRAVRRFWVLEIT